MDILKFAPDAMALKGAMCMIDCLSQSEEEKDQKEKKSQMLTSPAANDAKAAGGGGGGGKEKRRKRKGDKKGAADGEGGGGKDKGGVLERRERLEERLGAEAVAWFRQAADANHRHAQLLLATCLYAGEKRTRRAAEGRVRRKKKDEKRGEPRTRMGRG